jgi:hypothetical protein
VTRHPPPGILPAPSRRRGRACRASARCGDGQPGAVVQVRQAGAAVAAQHRVDGRGRQVQAGSDPGRAGPRCTVNRRLTVRSQSAAPSGTGRTRPGDRSAIPAGSLARNGGAQRVVVARDTWNRAAARRSGHPSSTTHRASRSRPVSLSGPYGGPRGSPGPGLSRKPSGPYAKAAVRKPAADRQPAARSGWAGEGNAAPAGRDLDRVARGWPMPLPIPWSQRLHPGVRQPAVSVCGALVEIRIGRQCDEIEVIAATCDHVTGSCRRARPCGRMAGSASCASWMWSATGASKGSGGCPPAWTSRTWPSTLSARPVRRRGGSDMPGLASAATVGIAAGRGQSGRLG